MGNRSASGCVTILVGLVLEALKYVNLAITPVLEAKLEHEYFIFRHSVNILLWSFVAALIVLAGAEWTARQDREEVATTLPDRGPEGRGPEVGGPEVGSPEGRGHCAILENT